MDARSDPSEVLEGNFIERLIETYFSLPPKPSRGWFFVDQDSFPEQGWKLHVSATINSASQVLNRVLPILKKHRVSFKVASDLGCLLDLNSGASGYSQVGKFITIYPPSDEQAVLLAKELETSTVGFAGPRIPSDQMFSPQGIVAYRFGGFKSLTVMDDLGQIEPAVRSPDGTLVPDLRGAEFSHPEWVCDPFAAAGMVEKPPLASGNLFGEYFILSLLHQAAKGGVYLAFDPRLTPPRTCVIKEGRRDMAVDPQGRNAQETLKAQYELLSSFIERRPFPQVYDYFEKEGNSYLVMEHLEGKTLETHALDVQARGGLLRFDEVARIGLSLAGSLRSLHEVNLIFRDLTPSNVLVHDENVYLVDFELAHAAGNSAVPYGWGTPGYVSPQQAAGLPPTTNDDIYALGATLYFALTCSPPAYLPPEATTHGQVITLIQGNSSDALPRYIDEMLSCDPTERPSSMLEVEEWLRRFLNRPPAHKQVSHAAVNRSNTDWLSAALKAGNQLISEANPMECGLSWSSQALNFQPEFGATHIPRARTTSCDLHNGAAGIALFLARLGVESGDDAYTRAARGAVEWLALTSQEPLLLPGLHFGQAGVAACIAEISEITGESDLLLAASEMMFRLDLTSVKNPDITHGLSGIGLAHLKLAHMGIGTHITAARELGDRILQNAEPHKTGLVWRQPAGPHQGMSSEILFGMAHGSAGVGYFLNQLGKATGDQRYSVAAKKAASALLSESTPFLEDATGVNWPIAANADPLDTSWLYWCHGASGIGLFFLDMAQEYGHEEYLEMAVRCAETVAVAGRRGGGVLCHGLPGNGMFLLHAAEELQEPRYRDAAYDIAALLKRFERQTTDGCVWPSEQSSVVTPDYMVGYSGTADFLLQASRPHHPWDRLQLPVV